MFLDLTLPISVLANSLLTLAGIAWLLLVVMLDQILKIRFSNSQ